MTLNLHTLVRALLLAAVGAAAWRAWRAGSLGLAIAATAAAAAVGAAIWFAYTRWRAAQGRRFILTRAFPAFLRDKLRATYPDLTDPQIADVERGLRQFFIASAQAGGRFVAMPSKVVDALWHEFILHTRGYEAFCQKAFGRLLHHTPAEALPEPAQAGADRHAGLRRAWYWSCREENIDPRRPDRLPLLFALDTTLAIPGGYRYVPDCNVLGTDRGSTHCGAGFGCGSSCGSSGGSDGGDGGGDGGGCGGGGD